jgi:hypothetical protein
MEGWGALLSGIVNFAGKFLDLKITQQLREHSNKYLELERALQVEMLKSYDDFDDFRIADLKVQMKQVRDAFNRDIALAGGQGGAVSS